MAVKRARRPARWALLAALGALAAAERRAPAHPEPSAAGTSRYVTATVVGGRIEVADAWLEGAVSAAEQRRAADTDRDGRISGGELLRAQAAAAAEAPYLAVALDGHPRAAAASVVIDLGGDDTTGAAPVALERRSTIALGGTPRGHELQLTLLREPAHLLETELSLDLEPGLVLVRPGDARARFSGPRLSALEQRAVSFAFAPAAPPAGNGHVGPALAASAAVAAAAVLLLLGRRARRRRVTSATG